MRLQTYLALTLLVFYGFGAIVRAQTLDAPLTPFFPSLSTQLSFEETSEAQDALLWENERHLRWQVHVRPVSPDIRLISEGEFEFHRTALDRHKDQVANRYAKLRIELDQLQPHGHYAFQYERDRIKDREGLKLHSDWPLNLGSLQTTVGQWWDNLPADTSQPRLLTSQAKASFKLTPPTWPTLTLSYLQGLDESIWKSPGDPPISQWLHTIGVSLYYGQTKGYTTTSAAYTLKRNRLVPEKRTTTYYYELSGAYYPFDKLFIMPTVSLYETRYQPSNMRFRTTSSSLSFTYQIWPNTLDLSLYGLYMDTESSDDGLHSHIVNATGQLTWNLVTLPLGNASISLHVAFYQYKDLHYEESSYESVNGVIFLNIIF